MPLPGYNIQSLFRVLPQHTVALRCAKALELPQNGFLRGNQTWLSRPPDLDASQRGVQWYGFAPPRWYVFSPPLTNLLFHEAGHLIFGLFGSTLGLYGGPLGQLVFPITTAVVFWWQKSLVSASVALLWFFENLNNIAPYVADARSQKLPLVGGGEHDWANILSRWGALEYDSTIATVLIVIAWLGLFSTLAWTTYLWWQCRKFYAEDPFSGTDIPEW